MQSNHKKQAFKKLVLGGGCFWCLEAIFQKVVGVSKVAPGYTDGTSVDPSYEEVCTGQTGHAEVIEITYEQSTVNLNTLLSVFFATHDPTTLNQQGNDKGTQYRSIICYSDSKEKEIIQEVIDKHQTDFDSEIVTQIAELKTFYPAEVDHHNYYQQNSSQAYCQMVIKPKLDKLVQWKEKNNQA